MLENLFSREKLGASTPKLRPSNFLLILILVCLLGLLALLGVNSKILAAVILIPMVAWAVRLTTRQTIWLLVPLTLIEAMSCGRAVVATEVGGVVDILGRRLSDTGQFTVWEHGVTAPSRDVQAFALALRFLIDRPELRAQMGRLGREFVRTKLSKARLVKDIEQMYSSEFRVPSSEKRSMEYRVPSSE